MKIIKGKTKVQVTGSLPAFAATPTVDTELPAAAALADATANPTVPIVGAALLGFNRATHDRIVVADTAGGAQASNVGHLAAVSMIWDPTGSVYAPAWGARVGDATTGARLPAHGTFGYNDATWDRLRTAPTTGVDLTTGVLTMVPHVVDVSAGNFQPLFRANNLGTGVAGDNFGGSVPMLRNGTTFDYQHNNTEGTLLASAARTATTTGSAQTNYNASGVTIYFRVTIAGTGGLTLRLWEESDASVTHGEIELLAATQITTASTYAYELYPGNGAAVGGVTKRVSGALGRSWYIDVVHADGSSWTYSVGHQLKL